MRLESRQGCPQVTCPAPNCSVCSSSETCNIIAPTFIDCNHVCPTVVCAAKQASSGGGISAGALAGALVAVFTLAVIACTAFFWWRRRRAIARAAAEKPPARPQDIPAKPDDVLSRPDPIEKTPTPVRSTFGLPSDAQSQRSVAAESFLAHDPFADQASIQTASARTHSPNVITIGLIPPPDGITALTPSPPPGPQRPVRSPDLSLRNDRSPDGSINLAHVNVSDDSLQPPNARFRAKSARSVRTTASRASTFSNASSAIDIMNEVPEIVTPKAGAVRQVLGVVKAEVVQVGSAANSPGLHPLARAPTRPTRSPLAQNSFTPDDIVDENPFGDEAGPSSHVTSSATSVKSTSTFGGQQSTPTEWTFPPTPTWPVDSRPMSMQSAAGTIIADIGSATRVVFGMQSPQYSTNAHPNSHISTGTVSTAQPATPPPTAQDVELTRRVSQRSIASSRADSILEAFPFVPPSPIAARPPRSPLGMTFTPPSPGARSVSSMSRQQHQSQQNLAVLPSPVEPQQPSQPATPGQRNTRALSTMSSSSGLSGLGAFPFKFEDTPPLPTSGKRASLDTLALSRDLEAFPLPYDDPLRDSFAPSSQ